MESQGNGKELRNVTTALSINPEHMLTKFSTVYSNGNVHINWTIVSFSEENTYWIERSSNGVEFEIIGLKEGSISGNGTEIIYTFTDFRPSENYSYYRIRFGRKLKYDGGKHLEMTNDLSNAPVDAELVFN